MISVLCSLAILMGFTVQPWGSWQQPVDRMVTVGSYRLHFRVIQGRGPVILLDAGGGLDATQWVKLAPRIAAATGASVVSYDRAGMGESDLPKRTYDIREEVEDLLSGLSSLGLAQSLLLVGHSYSGFTIQLLAHDHPTAVIGCLFIDPNTSEFVDAVGGPDALFKDPPKLSPNPTKLELNRDRVLRAYAATVKVIRNAPLPKTVTVRVITAGKQGWPTAEWNAAFRASHEHLAASVPGGRLIIAERSGHMIPDEQPDIVLETIQEMLRVRGQSSR